MCQEGKTVYVKNVPTTICADTLSISAGSTTTVESAEATTGAGTGKSHLSASNESTTMTMEASLAHSAQMVNLKLDVPASPQRYR